MRDSQAQALDQTEAAASESQDPRAQALWAAAVKEMEKALARLTEATNSSLSLNQALVAEQGAYQALLKLQEHEYQVVRNRKNQGGGGPSDARMRQQLEQMDLTQSEDRYETQRQAQRAQKERFGEQLQILNRLQELARRQQDLNERFQELQTALEKARTEQEREELRRRLKRLEEEEQQMLADADELRQRMDRPENQSQMSEQRRQLEQTRQDLQRAAEASQQGNASQALSAGRRAAQQLEQLRDQVRKENSNQFAEDLRQMRAEARELSRQQEQLDTKLAAGTEAERGPKSLSDAPERESWLQALAQQKQRLTNLVDHATQISQQAEDAEPLLSRQLYDTLRKFSQDNSKNIQDAQEDLLARRLMTDALYERLKASSDSDASKLLELTTELLRQNFRQPAAQTAERAGSAFKQLQQGVERAAESIVGDDTEALRLAQSQLDQITGQLQREIAQAEGNGANETARTNAPGKAESSSPSTEQARSATEATRQSDSGKNGEQTQASKAPGDSSSKSEQSGSGQVAQQGSPASANDSAGEPQAGNTSSSSKADQARSSAAQRNRGSLGANAGGAGGAWLDNFNRRLSDNREWQGGPITGGDYGPWSDNLREIEEVIEDADLRHEVATARERARLMRQEFKRERKKPDWAVVRLQVINPLLEVRQRISDELARRQSADALVPIDRDPVPTRYSDLVRRYYEEIGKDKRPAAQ